MMEGGTNGDLPLHNVDCPTQQEDGVLRYLDPFTDHELGHSLDPDLGFDGGLSNPTYVESWLNVGILVSLWM